MLVPGRAAAEPHSVGSMVFRLQTMLSSASRLHTMLSASRDQTMFCVPSTAPHNVPSGASVPQTTLSQLAPPQSALHTTFSALWRDHTMLSSTSDHTMLSSSDHTMLSSSDQTMLSSIRLQTMLSMLSAPQTICSPAGPAVAPHMSPVVQAFAPGSGTPPPSR